MPTPSGSNFNPLVTTLQAGKTYNYDSPDVTGKHIEGTGQSAPAFTGANALIRQDGSVEILQGQGSFTAKSNQDKLVGIDTGTERTNFGELKSHQLNVVKVTTDSAGVQIYTVNDKTTGKTIQLDGRDYLNTKYGFKLPDGSYGIPDANLGPQTGDLASSQVDHKLGITTCDQTPTPSCDNTPTPSTPTPTETKTPTITPTPAPTPVPTTVINRDIPKETEIKIKIRKSSSSEVDSKRLGYPQFKPGVTVITSKPPEPNVHGLPPTQTPSKPPAPSTSPPEIPE